MKCNVYNETFYASNYAMEIIKTPCSYSEKSEYTLDRISKGFSLGLIPGNQPGHSVGLSCERNTNGALKLWWGQKGNSEIGPSHMLYVHGATLLLSYRYTFTIYWMLCAFLNTFFHIQTLDDAIL